MKVLILGDFHGKFAAASQHYNNIRKFFKGVSLDLLIQVGDFGFFPRDSNPWKKDLDHEAFFIDGNHDDHWTLKNLSKPNWGLDPKRVSNLREWENCLNNIWEYKPRGSIDRGVLYIGGARSVNPKLAPFGTEWFPEENISFADQQYIFRAIEDYGPENIHTVITHDCPGSFDVSKACSHSGIEMIDGNRKFLESIKCYVNPQRWYFGHYHLPMSGVKDGVYWRCVDQIRGKGFDDFVLIDFPDVEE